MEGSLPSRSGSHDAVLIGPAAVPLASLLPDLIPALSLREFPDLYGAGPALLASPPLSLWMDGTQLGEEDLGSLRLLRRLLPHCRFVLILPPRKRKNDLARLATELGFGILPSPPRARQVLALMEGRFEAQGPLSQDLLAGLADQINNPLAALAGRLQLLRILLPGEGGEDFRDNLDLAAHSAGRIQEALEKLGHLSGRRNPVLRRLPLLSFVRGLFSELQAERLGLPEVEEEADQVLADDDMLKAALKSLLRVALDLCGEEGRLALAWEAGEGRLGLRLSEALPLPCRPAELFLPFRLGRLLRDPDLGLDLAVARTLLEAMEGSLEGLTESGFLLGFRLRLPRG